MSYSDEELLDEIRRVADVADSDGAPTVAQFSEYSDIADSTIHRRFGSWNAGITAAGFDPRPAESRVSTAALIDELQRLGDEREQVPTREGMDTDGAYGSSTYKNRFGSWGNALEAAGFEPRRVAVAVSTADLVAELERLREAEGEIPTAEQMAANGQYAVTTYARRFGSWRYALEAVFGAVPANRQGRVSDAMLRAELRRVADEHGVPPRFEDMREHGAHAPQTYLARFGSWNAALEAAGFEPRSPNRVSTDDLLADLHRLRDELGRRPTATDVVEGGAHGIATYQRRFGSWSAAVVAAFDDVSSVESAATEPAAQSESVKLSEQSDQSEQSESSESY